MEVSYEQASHSRVTLVDGKTPLVAAVSIGDEGHSLAIRFSQMRAFSKEAIKAWAQKHLAISGIYFSVVIFAVAMLTARLIFGQVVEQEEIQ